jgi:hypothetical protein
MPDTSSTSTDDRFGNKTAGISDAHSEGASFVADLYGITQEVGERDLRGSHFDGSRMPTPRDGVGDRPSETRQGVINLPS